MHTIGMMPGEVFPSTAINRERRFGFGDRGVDHVGNEYVYAKAAATITGAGYVCFLSTTYTATMISTSNDARGQIIGLAPGAMAADDEGWFQVKGLASARVAASAAANTRLNTTATAGQIDDDGTAGSMQVQGVYLTTANGGAAALAPCVLNHPYVDATL